MKESNFRKIVCWSLVCLMSQPAFGQEASIMLYYKPGINNVSFTYNGAHDSLNPINVFTEEYPDGTIIKASENKMNSGSKTQLSMYASNYVNNLKLFNHMVGLDTKSSSPSQLNFWITGSLSINGQNVAQDLSLGMLSGYWWYGSQYGTSYTGSNVVTDKGMEFADKSGNSYCLKEPSSNSDELFVYKSTCADAGGNYASNAGKEKQSDFSFVFGQGINSISFDISNNQSEDGSGHKLGANAISLDNQGLQTRVLVTAGENGSLGTATEFNRLSGYTNNNLNMSHILELIPAIDPDAHKPSAASNQNFWLTGKLTINGEEVKGNIVLGHNSEKDGNWWLGNAAATRYDSPSNSGLNVVGVNDGKTYCINDSGSNYQAVVTSGECNDYSPSTGKMTTPMITFSYGTKDIKSVTFTPELMSNKESYVSENGMGNPLQFGSFANASPGFFDHSSWVRNHQITITAGESGSYGTACDFNAQLGKDVNSQMLHSLELMDRKKSNAHELALAQNMNFWIKGTLAINGDTATESFVVGHSGESDQNWWVGTPDGERYDSTTNSGLNVQTVDIHSQIHQYCLNQSKNNHSFVVSKGICSPQTYDVQSNKKLWIVVGVVILVVVVVAGLIGVCASTDICKFKKEAKDIEETEPLKGKGQIQGEGEGAGEGGVTNTDDEKDRKEIEELIDKHVRYPDKPNLELIDLVKMEDGNYITRNANEHGFYEVFGENPRGGYDPLYSTRNPKN